MFLRIVPPTSRLPNRLITYLSGSTDNKEREIKPRLIFGNPTALEVCAAASWGNSTYKQILGGWSPAETPLLNDEAILKTIYRIISTFSSPISPDRLVGAAFLHESTARYDFHIVLNQIDLKTGKSFDPFPPGSGVLLEALLEKINIENGWQRPSDAALRLNLAHERLHEKINQALHDIREKARQQAHWSVMTAAPRCNSIHDIVAVLSELGAARFIFSNRPSNDFVEFFPHGWKSSPLQMRGLLYHRDFCYAEYARALKSDSQYKPPPRDSQQAKQLLNEADAVIAKKLAARHALFARWQSKTEGQDVLPNACLATKILISEASFEKLPSDIHQGLYVPDRIPPATPLILNSEFPHLFHVPPRPTKRKEKNERKSDDRTDSPTAARRPEHSGVDDIRLALSRRKKRRSRLDAAGDQLFTGVEAVRTKIGTNLEPHRSRLEEALKAIEASALLEGLGQARKFEHPKPSLIHRGPRGF